MASHAESSDPSAPEDATAPPDDTPAAPVASALDDPEYRRGVVELLGVLAFGEISACERLVADSQMAPDLRSKVEVATMAAAEFDHFEVLRDRLVEMGEDPFDAMEPFAGTFGDFHRKTKPADFLEGLVKAFVGDGLAADFYREIAAYLDPVTRTTVIDTLSGTGHSEFVVEQVRAAIEADPRVGGRLALCQAQTLVAERDALSAVLVGGVETPGLDLTAISRMFTRITEAHTERMARLGLAA